MTDEKKQKLFEYMVEEYESYSIKEIVREIMARMNEDEMQEELRIYKEIESDDG